VGAKEGRGLEHPGRREALLEIVLEQGELGQLLFEGLPACIAGIEAGQVAASLVERGLRSVGQLGANAEDGALLIGLATVDQRHGSLE
jgi:hypothetical protein